MNNLSRRLAILVVALGTSGCSVRRLHDRDDRWARRR